MKFKDMINGLEKIRGKPMTENEILLLVKIWNAVVECVADEWPALANHCERILKLKEPAKEKHAGH